MKTFKDLVKGNKIYYLSNNKITSFIFEEFSPFDDFFRGKAYNLIISDPTDKNTFEAAIIFDKPALNFTHFFNYYSCLESLILDIINGDV